MLFPNGIWHYIVGGVIIGIALSAIYILTGIQAGSSGWFRSVWGKLLNYDLKKDRQWRNIFTVATILGAFLYALIFDDFFVTGVSWWKLLIGGFLVGVGARAANGCTSGHGLCGFGASKKSSIVFVLIIIITAVLTGWLI